MASTQKLRPAQEEILKYDGGRLGISAVPGSGKTFTLSRLAARLVQKLAESGPVDDREVLVVTLTNAAAENFRYSIGQFIQSRRLLPSGYRVRTLHSLAHDIVRERPGLVGLSEDFDIIDDRTSQDIKRQAVNNYLQSNPDVLGAFIKPEFLNQPSRITRRLPETGQEIADAAIRRVKELRADPIALDKALAHQAGAWPLLSFAVQIHMDYQRGLSVRGGVDFDDLILHALQALETDENLLARLQIRWPYVLEDEAQDSSALQEQMLTLLSAAHGNWVRVGDPNQAIHTTFTSAHPKFLRDFVSSDDVHALPLPNSGRCSRPIIELANLFINWSRNAHPVLSQKEALSPPLIEPTEPGDPQPNPPPGEPAVFFYDRPLTPAQEIDTLVKSLDRWLAKHPKQTAAVLVPDNRRGADFGRALEKASLPYDDSLLQSTSATRAAVDTLVHSMRFIGQPSNPSYLRSFWSGVWWPRLGARRLLEIAATGTEPEGRPTTGSEDLDRCLPAWVATSSDHNDDRQDEPLPKPVTIFSGALGRLQLPERFVYPAAGDDWLHEISWIGDYDHFPAVVNRFRQDLQRWCGAAVLPVDELILTLGQDLFTDASDLALAHSAAIVLAQRAAERPNLRLPELTRELEEIASRRRRLLGFSEESRGFEPPAGKVTVATMHTAKGLEWDRVHLASVSDYSFPSGGDDSDYRGERWFVRDHLNLTEEAQEQIEHLHMGTMDEYLPGSASRSARKELAAERLRLLYVGITRARQELILTYNTGSRHETNPNQPALAFTSLEEAWRHCHRQH